MFTYLNRRKCRDEKSPAFNYRTSNFQNLHAAPTLCPALAQPFNGGTRGIPLNLMDVEARLRGRGHHLCPDEVHEPVSSFRPVYAVPFGPPPSTQISVTRGDSMPHDSSTPQFNAFQCGLYGLARPMAGVLGTTIVENGKIR